LPEQLPTPLANACRALARQVLDVMEIDQPGPLAGLYGEDAQEVGGRLPAAEMPMRLSYATRR
jgi:hypothetical protein